MFWSPCPLITTVSILGWFWLHNFSHYYGSYILASVRAKHCEFYFVRSFMFLWPCKYSYTLLWGAFKLLGNCFIPLSLAFEILVSQTHLVQSIITNPEKRPFWIVYSVPHELWGFSVWLVETGIIHGPAPSNFLGVIPSLLGSFLTCIPWSVLWEIVKEGTL